ncbi:hypothetical protein FRC00_003684 [Tulasnella sp. 408]|nr:hypothetical protein FRC00_003684 [Tulasnella sp. 408]
MLGKLFSAHPAGDLISALALRPSLFGRVVRKSIATAAPRLSLFGRVIFKVKTAFRLVRIEEKVMMASVKRSKIVSPNRAKKGQEGRVHLPQDVHLIEQESTLASKQVAAAGFVSTPPPRPSLSPTITPSPTSSSSSTSLTAPSSMPSSNSRPPFAKSRLEHAAYVQRVEKMNMPCAIKKLTEERDLFRARLEPAKQEYARKAAGRKLVEQEWKEEQERRPTAQPMVITAKYELEKSAKQYDELEAKFL